MNERTTKRQNWRTTWKGYTWPNAHGTSRPQSDRKTRRQYWRDAWREREPGEYAPPAPK